MEKIKQIEISNFKSIKHLQIDGLKKINLFIGYPNAGKSNILEALSIPSLVDKLKPHVKLNIKDFFRFSDFSNLFFEGNISNVCKVNISDYTYILGLKDEILTVRGQENQSYVQGILKFSFNDELLLSHSPIIFKTISPSIKNYIFKPEQSISKIGSLTYLHFPFGENIGQIISNYPVLRKEVNEFFIKNNLKLLIERNTKELKIFKEYKDGTVFTLPYNLIADTLQRLIFYKAAIQSNTDSVLLFEEPEAHCFEPYILEFTNSVKYDKNDNQFFIVTHSDFIIQEFLRDEESKNNTNIYLVNNVDGETKVKLLDKEKNEDVYELGMNPFFNFENLWEAN